MSVESMEVDEPIFPVRHVLGWAHSKMSYRIDGSLPSNETEARRVQRRSKAYTIINMELYKRSATTILQRCVEPEEGQEMLLEIHQGECGHHACSRALVAKVFRHGFYWLTPLQQAEDIVRRCKDLKTLLTRSTCRLQH